MNTILTIAIGGLLVAFAAVASVPPITPIAPPHPVPAE
jgi:hypothetical protein